MASVVIPTCDRPAFLAEALGTVKAQDFPGRHFEIIIVDNGAEPSAALAALSEEASRPVVRYVYEARNGLHYARHAGATACRGEIVVYIDDDVACPQGWLAQMLAPYAEPRVSMVAGRVVLRYEDAPPDWLFQFRGILSELDWGEGAHPAQPYRSPVGCNMSVRRSTLFAVGGFNPDGFGDSELVHLRGDGECGLSRKVHDRGLIVWYAPDAWLEHRVPRERMTWQYVRRRSALGGIEAAYADLRYSGRSCPGLVAMSIRSGGIWAVHRAAALWCRHDTSSRIRRLAAADWHLHRAHQHARQALSRPLRSYTRRTSYIDDA